MVVGSHKGQINNFWGRKRVKSEKKERFNRRVNNITETARALSPTILRALSMSMPWLQGTAGLARQSPALPLRDTSTRCRRRYRKASAITRMASCVSADVYWDIRSQERNPQWRASDISPALYCSHNKVITSPAVLGTHGEQCHWCKKQENKSFALWLT